MVPILFASHCLTGEPEKGSSVLWSICYLSQELPSLRLSFVSILTASPLKLQVPIVTKYQTLRQAGEIQITSERWLLWQPKVANVLCWEN